MASILSALKTTQQSKVEKHVNSYQQKSAARHNSARWRKNLWVLAESESHKIISLANREYLKFETITN